MTRHDAADRHHGWRWGKASASVLALAQILLLFGCGSVQPRYYTLTPWPGTPQSGGPPTVEVQTPTVAEYLNRDYIVVSNIGDQLHLAQNAAWAEPLSDGIGRNLALDLSQRLPGSDVYTANSGISSTAKAVVEINVSHFAEDDAGQAEIMAMVSVHGPDFPVADIRSLHVVTPLKDKSMGALAASLSQLLGQVADEVAKDLRTLSPTRPKTAFAGPWP